MLKLLRESGLLLSIMCGVAYAEPVDPPVTSGKSSSPLGSLTVGYAYLYADQGKLDYRNLNGWYVKPSWNITPKTSLYLDFSIYYGGNKYGALNSHSYTMGVSRTVLSKPKFKLAPFVQTGDVRISANKQVTQSCAGDIANCTITTTRGSITHAYLFLAGFSVTVPLTKWVSFTAVPAEYVFQYPNGDPRHNFNAKAGFSFPLGHRKNK